MMKSKPFAETIYSLCPGVPEDLVHDHCEHLDSRYFSCFPLETIAYHVKKLALLSPENPVEAIFEMEETGNLHCTILATDYPYVFSFITGVLSSMGFSIHSGNIFTYSPGKSDSGTREKKMSFFSGRRKIIDHFYGKKNSHLSDREWQAETVKRIREVFRSLENVSREGGSKAKQRVNEMVSEKLSASRIDSSSMLFPLTISIHNNNPGCTLMQIISQDTPFFLYALSNALSGQKILIERVSIRTIENRIEDEFCIVNGKGKKITDPHLLNQVKLAVLLTKQFTYFLTSAPDPFSALSRFEALVKDILQLPKQGKWFDLLSDPKIMQDLARLLGASDFLWEDFIRIHYENLLPIFASHVEKHKFSQPLETLETRLRDALAGTDSYEEKRKRLNEFKDKEIYLMDLDHILTPGEDFKQLSKRLTCLAEHIVQAALTIAYDMLSQSFGIPSTIAGIPARFAVFGLGKTGGAALGYASDIELLLIYSDAGTTNGNQQISNSDFFERLVKSIVYLIKAKREGIFHIDLRLRPYGKDGPLACSLQSFCQYYGQGGRAHPLEKLALVRLRVIAGDMEFGSLVEQLRDDMIYFVKKKIRRGDLQKAREIQFAEKTRQGTYNAKFSPGTLVDLEYDVQILQVTYGDRSPSLRTPWLHKALEGLATAGVLSEKESKNLTQAYGFFRKLINGLRMLRGSALDLTLPPVTSNEYTHLAQRIGYRKEGEVSPALQLRLDFETTMAMVRTFVERHFGRKTLPGPVSGNAADLILSDHPPEELISSVLSQAGFKNIKRAFKNLRLLAGGRTRRDLFARLSILAVNILIRMPDPDMALNNWERFCSILENPEEHFRGLLAQPMRLEILLRIFSISQYLSQVLIQNPQFLDRVTEPETLHRLRKRGDMEKELRIYISTHPDRQEWLSHIRLFKKQEILRTGIRDICLHKPITDIVQELSLLAEVMVQMSFERGCIELGIPGTSPGTGGGESVFCPLFCLLAFGKCGGSELNYSSDIDLLALFDDRTDGQVHTETAEKTYQLFSKLMGLLVSDLSGHTSQGYVYRVDLRLRPYGDSGTLIHSFSSLVDYYETKASLWEIQALLKLRPIAGNMKRGEEFLSQIFHLFSTRSKKEEIVQSIETMRNKKIHSVKQSIFSGVDVKSGIGGIRDIEFLTQGLQLIHIREYPGLYERNTLKALAELGKTGILPRSAVNTLQADYIFLRRVEHFLQIYEDRQVHSLPGNPAELGSLARKISGPGSDPKEFLHAVEECLARVRGYYETYLLGAG
jgi:[glutamine synthetase] adenylyltransferase / [glutamine synthetase]-adenylyl-L-tyrosine phosphorylase